MSKSEENGKHDSKVVSWWSIRFNSSSHELDQPLAGAGFFLHHDWMSKITHRLNGKVSAVRCRRRCRRSLEKKWRRRPDDIQCSVDEIE